MAVFFLPLRQQLFFLTLGSIPKSPKSLEIAGLFPAYPPFFGSGFGTGGSCSSIYQNCLFSRRKSSLGCAPITTSRLCFLMFKCFFFIHANSGVPPILLNLGTALSSASHDILFCHRCLPLSRTVWDWLDFSTTRYDWWLYLWWIMGHFYSAMGTFECSTKVLHGACAIYLLSLEFIFLGSMTLDFCPVFLPVSVMLQSYLPGKLSIIYAITLLAIPLAFKRHGLVCQFCTVKLK